MTIVTFVDSNNQVAYSYNLIKNVMKPNIRIMITKENGESFNNDYSTKLLFLFNSKLLELTVMDYNFGDKNYCVFEIPNSFFENVEFHNGDSVTIVARVKNYMTNEFLNEETAFATVYMMEMSLQGSIEYINAKLCNKLENRGIILTGEEGLLSLVHKVKEITKSIIDDDASADHSSTLFGNHISLRNSGTATVGYDSNGYYTLTNTTNSAECFVELPQLQGIYDKSFKVTVRSKCETINKCPFALYYYLDANNWGGVKDETTTLWTSAKTNGTFSENSTQTGNASDIEVVNEFFFNATDKTLTVKDYVNGTLKSSKSMSIPVTLDSTVKWGTTTTWGTNAVRKVYEIKAEYTLLYAPLLEGAEPVVTLDTNFPFTTANGYGGGGHQVGYVADGFDNSKDWELTMTLQTSNWDGGFALFLEPYPLQTCSGYNNKIDCIFHNGQADMLQWIDGNIRINSGSNLTNTGMTYRTNTTLNVKMVKNGNTLQYYENNTLKGTYNWAKLTVKPKVYLGICTWGDASTSVNRFSNVRVEEI